MLTSKVRRCFKMLNVENHHKTRGITLVLLLAIFIGAGIFSARLDAEAGTPYVMLQLRDGNLVKFDYPSFAFNWIYPITLKSQITCETFEITKEDIDEVYVKSEFYNNCDEKDDWEVNVYLTNGEEVLGFFKLSDYTVTGKLFASGEEKTIQFKDIKKVSFHR